MLVTDCIENSPKGYVKEKVYNAIDQVMEEREIDKQHGIQRVFQYLYDPNGNVITRIDKSIEEQERRTIKMKLEQQQGFFMTKTIVFVKL